MAKNQVVIIGAGIAGLSAACELIENGITNLVILEAQNRIGGRIHTMPTDIEDGQHNIELGAQWIHGEKGNPIFELCRKLGNVDKEHKTEFSDIMYYATQDGYKIDDDDVDKVLGKIDKIFDKMEDEIDDIDEDQSIGDMLNQRFNDYLAKERSKGTLDDDRIRIIKAIFKGRLLDEKADTACDDLCELSAKGWNEYETYEGDNMVNLKYGYKRVIEHFASRIPEDRILLNEVVTKIQWPSDQLSKEEIQNYMVIVTTYNTVTKTESQYYGYYCLCTMSLGVLKANYRQLFEPALPPNKSRAIENLGFGIVNKIFIIFDQPLFKHSVQGLQILWRDDIELKLESVIKWNLTNQKFYKSFATFEIAPNMSNVLYTFITGDDAKYTETLSNECLLEVIHELLVKCFNKIKIPKPRALVKSAWSSNNFVKGSYSYIRLGASMNDVKNLAMSLNGKVYFAGEATAFENYSTVHGAHISGVKAADSMIRNLRKKE